MLSSAKGENYLVGGNWQMTKLGEKLGKISPKKKKERDLFLEHHFYMSLNRLELKLVGTNSADLGNLIFCLLDLCKECNAGVFKPLRNKLSAETENRSETDIQILCYIKAVKIAL